MVALPTSLSAQLFPWTPARQGQYILNANLFDKMKSGAAGMCPRVTAQVTSEHLLQHCPLHDNTKTRSLVKQGFSEGYAVWQPYSFGAYMGHSWGLLGLLSDKWMKKTVFRPQESLKVANFQDNVTNRQWKMHIMYAKDSQNCGHIGFMCTSSGRLVTAIIYFSVVVWTTS